MTSEWFLIDDTRPDEGQKVLVMLKDTKGYNVIYRNGIFHLERDESVCFALNNVMFWKPRDGFEDYGKQVKKCGACGIYRR